MSRERDLLLTHSAHVVPMIPRSTNYLGYVFNIYLVLNLRSVYLLVYKERKLLCYMGEFKKIVLIEQLCVAVCKTENCALLKIIKLLYQSINFILNVDI